MSAVLCACVPFSCICWHELPQIVLFLVEKPVVLGCKHSYLFQLKNVGKARVLGRKRKCNVWRNSKKKGKEKWEYYTEKKERENDWEEYTNINIKRKSTKLVVLHRVSGWVGRALPMNLRLTMSCREAQSLGHRRLPGMGCCDCWFDCSSAGNRMNQTWGLGVRVSHSCGDNTWMFC